MIFPPGEPHPIQSGPSGTTLPSSEYVLSGVPVVTARDVRTEGINGNPKVNVSRATADRLRRYTLQTGDILLVRIGQTTRHAIATRINSDWLVGGSCLRIRATSIVEPEYLACYLCHPAVQEWIATHTVGSEPFRATS